jgi:sugar O-acyltransferase (sialic acid O-acetyltransferase NeuD family)
MKKIAIYGSGGFGIEIYFILKDIINNDDAFDYDFIGFFDDKQIETPHGSYLGGINQLNSFSGEINIIIGIGSPQDLRKVRERIINPNVFFPNIVHHTCKFISKETLRIGEGNIFLTGCTLSCNVVIGNFNIFNTNTTIGHDVNLRDFNVFSPNVIISGNVCINDENLFGFNCGVIQGRKIGNKNVIGASSALIRNINDNGTYFGVPANKINK